MQGALQTVFDIEGNRLRTVDAGVPSGLASSAEADHIVNQSVSTDSLRIVRV